MGAFCLVQAVVEDSLRNRHPYGTAKILGEHDDAHSNGTTSWRIKTLDSNEQLGMAHRLLASLCFVLGIAKFCIANRLGL